MRGAPRRFGGLVAATLLALPACESGAAPGTTLDREVFVSTYVDLRAAALENPSGEIDPAARDRVLRDHGVTEEQLLEFAEVHGTDPVLMREVWDEVEARLGALSPVPDTSS